MYDSDRDPRTYEEFVKAETNAATVEITFDGIPPDGNDRVSGLTEGEEAKLVVELTVVGTGDEGEALPEGVEADSIALIGTKNRVTVTCPEQVDAGPPADCDQFTVGPPNPQLQDYEVPTFEFDFTPLVQGEIRVVVVVEAVLDVVGGGVDTTNEKKVVKEFELDIIVSPQRDTWNKLRSAADTTLTSLLQTEVPEATKGVPVEVTSTFTYPAGLQQLDGLTVDLHLATDGKAEIPPGDLVQSGRTVTRTWTVTPYEAGPLELRFWLVAESEFFDGEQYTSAERTEFLQVSEPAAPPPGRFEELTETADGIFSTAVYVAGGLAVLVGLLSALGVKTWWQKRQTLAAAAAGSETGEPPTG